jgi:hypothetical protein
MDFAVRPTERDLRPTPHQPQRKRRSSGEREVERDERAEAGDAPREHEEGLGESLDLTA